MLDILDKRMRRIIAIAREGAEEDDDPTAGAECFHLMELKQIVEGKPTCGVFDDFGAPPKPPTISGPLFLQQELIHLREIKGK